MTGNIENICFKLFLLSIPVVVINVCTLTNLPASEVTEVNIFEIPLEELHNIEITSTSYFPETPLDVASTVTVITPQNWQKRGARRYSDALSNLPSVIAIPNFLGQSSIRIRGYALSDARGIATLWDGVSINSFNLATADVDRPNIQLDTLSSIEVTRGPGSSLYGSDAFHGVVALNSFKSDQDINIIRSRISSNRFYSSSFNSSVGINNDLRLTLSLASSGQPDQNINYTGSDGKGEREYNFGSNTVVAKLSSESNTAISYNFGLYYDDNDSNNFTGGGKVEFGYDANKDVSSTDTNLAMVKADIKYNFSKLNSINFESYYWKQKRDFEVPSGSNNIFINGEEHREAFKLIYRNEFGNTQTSAVLSNRHDKIERQHLKIFNATTTIRNEDLPFSGSDRHINSFLVDTKTGLMNNKWIVRFGFRLDNYSDFGSQFTPRVGVIYRINSTSVVKFLHGNAFRAANATELSGTVFIKGNPNIRPEELKTNEFIYLNQTEDSKIELIAFSSNWKNGINAVSNNNQTGLIFANINTSSAYGLEGTYQKKFERLLIEANGSYVKSKNDTNNIAYVAFPKMILNLGLGYSFPANYSLYIQNRALLGVNDSPIKAPFASNTLKKYGRMDINLRKTFKDKWVLNSNIRNLLNRKNFLPSLVNSEGGVPENEISFDIGISYKF